MRDIASRKMLLVFFYRRLDGRNDALQIKQINTILVANCPERQIPSLPERSSRVGLMDFGVRIWTQFKNVRILNLYVLYGMLVRIYSGINDRLSLRQRLLDQYDIRLFHWNPQFIVLSLSKIMLVVYLLMAAKKDIQLSNRFER